MSEQNKNIQSEDMRTTLPVIPTVDVVVFPHMVVPLLVLDPKIIHGIKEASNDSKKVLLLATQSANQDNTESAEPIGVDDLYSVGTIGEIIRIMDLAEGGIKILIQGIQKAKIVEIAPTDITLKAVVEVIEDQPRASQEKIDDALKSIVSLIEQLPANNATFSPDFPVILSQIENPYKAADFILSHLTINVSQSQELLEKESLIELLQAITVHIQGIIASSEIEEKIRSTTRDSINKSQREYYLREQLRAIQKELGDDNHSDIDDFEQQATQIKLSEEARVEVDRQIKRLKRTAADSLEATVLRNHIEWILGLPWDNSTEDSNNILEAKKILDEEHFGLEEVKERILDFLSIKYLKQDCKSPIICLAGAPGVGKTSLGKSIAKCMNRMFERIALGGVHDEAELRGHRRTYVGALPGRFIQAVKKAGSSNPVLLIDEIDKIGASHKGDPSAALLEILDPEQNATFYDNYLGVPYDLSKVMFVATANDISMIQGPLRDRMEIIQLSGYTLEEKIEIARRHLIPRIIQDSGLGKTTIAFSSDVISELITGYTQEAGVRRLSKIIQTLCAKFARKYIENEEQIVFTPENIAEHLGPRQLSDDYMLGADKVGITNGLAWTPFGGQVLQVEAVLMPGTGKLILTGQLGDVMKESAQAAVSYARAHAHSFNIAPEKFTQYDLHIHLPAGSIPKDGPSAGITLLSSIFSVYTERPINGKYAMTGELNLQGNVLAIGGVKEKLLAAKQRGMSHVIFPRQNEKDIMGLKQRPHGVDIIFVDSVEQVLKQVLM